MFQYFQYFMLTILILVLSVAQIESKSELHLASIYNTTEIELNYEHLIVDCLNEITAAVQKDIQTSLLIKYKANETETQIILERIVTKFLRSSTYTPTHIGYVEDPEKNLIFFNMRLFLIDSLDSLMQLLEEILDKIKESFFLKYLIILITNNSKHIVLPNQRIIQEIFEKFNEYFIEDVSVLIPTGHDIVQIFTIFPYGDPTACDSSKPKLVYTYRRFEQLPHINQVFPYKYANLNGCTLRIGITHAPPFMMLQTTTGSLTQRRTPTGLDGELLKLFAAIMNFSIEIVETASRGYVFENGTVSGIFEVLQQRRANLVMSGCGCYPNRMRLFAPTSPYYQTKIHIAVRTPHIAVPILSLLKPFKITVWLIFLALVIVRYSAPKILQVHKSQFRFQILSPTFKRYLFAMWLIVSLLFRAGYESFYFMKMHERKPNPIPQTINDLHAAGFTIVADESLTNLFSNYGLSHIIHFYPMKPDQTFEILTKSDNKYAVLAKDEYLIYYLSKHPEQIQQLLVTHQVVVNNVLCIYFPRTSYLVHRFNWLLWRLLGNGIISKFTHHFIHSNYMSFHDKLKSRYKSSKELLPLGWDILRGPLLVLHMVNGVSVFIFILELLSPRCRLLRNLLNML